MKGTLVFDIESHERRKMYSMPPEEFCRLMGYCWDDGEVVITTDVEELRREILKARWIIGHNIHDFDLRAVFGIESNIPMKLADQGRVFDTWTHAVLVHPAPYKSINRFGKPATYNTPEKMTAWFSLDEQAYQLGVTGKTDNLGELALEFGDPDIKTKKERKLDGFGKIPVYDERYRKYLVGDVRASSAIAKKLMALGGLTKYALREQRVESRKACISSNGIRVDVAKATARRDKLKVNRDRIVAELVEKYNFPNDPTKKQPWRSKEGKEAIKKALADRGITQGSRPAWPRGEKTGEVSLGGKVLLELTKGSDAEELGTVLAELMGQRSLAQLTLDSMYEDGFVHPEITMLQRSGRWSTTNPGLTVWTAHGPGAIEKEYLIPDYDDHVFCEIDASNADARIVAWLSGDKKYAVRFQPGQDGHMINALAAWGPEVVATDPKGYRQKGKPMGHGWSYGGGYKTLSVMAGVPEPEAKAFCEGMNNEFVGIVSWQNAVRAYARAHGYVVNPWGRKMWVEKGREWTQSPALLGQSGTRELMCDALLEMPHNVVRMVKGQIHDALLFSIPRCKFEAGRDYLIDLMTVTLPPPPGGQEMDFPMDSGPPGENWYLADHNNVH